MAFSEVPSLESEAFRGARNLGEQVQRSEPHKPGYVWGAQRGESLQDEVRRFFLQKKPQSCEKARVLILKCPLGWWEGFDA
jgi:hypothetical protein